ncbi:U4/U6.U5 tri-snRNP-associated protein 2 [Cryptococcus neoformans C23]|uniref:U4/U6.U5 tri-snRNP-associated protein 2 n=1 Tax=Cryptococcus neoformans (strain H99 / ATCC 208821 / CBS 10515 / FGSC 9487) TaxID=235443 RepID=J9VYT0_CRYN9|nr:U4/U6.U5 tri-snRNP-associated protein 2 [Cryptococcus neoformans var. grubii H99]OWZ27583.1 U4/U6.U5 tri-snRNP-associated protein 2 [Cryptococcus neoformans var. grubii AD2-60a]OWZ32698.1 U4/U6.U5 tri-snRNP-associated protein 2 [Cryptococcus neoformans var. grubii AD1-83a]OWZ39887.1 U4/U6.U5 tri-snRNP-associated protein 2 [Cryptococcus neoformans var. grubii C23]OWZ50966.1 U4/U6.U5 tri-snRNP-associated protein 2 [Cryptococcus neoformans var. grubii 125.91]OXG15029.1 U4/U6.U5 tri-snRNP-assoc|eukprot:XP_012052643.1 U4/U6.U5 tri-snRNP-associated protein 2 [Cryptococcus neoformans var. grubii H99]
MSTASPPALSPPAAKRIKLDTEGVPLSSPLKSQQDPSELPPATSAPEILSASTFTPPVDEDISDEEGLEDVKEEEDLTRRDMYLDTISRQSLDFDFEKLCSKSLSNINVYACLVCGKYFQGRGKGSWAYRHAVGDNHRVWLNLDTEKFYVLPEGYPVSDPSLNDILRVLHPRYNASDIKALSALPAPSYTLSGQQYTPGFIGVNNIKKNDYCNVVIHLLLHVPPLRNFLLNPNTPELQEERRPTELVKRFATLARRLWNSHLFKSQISPHEFLQEVSKRSNGKFKTTEQGDPVELLGWLVNTLHRDLGGSKKRNSSIIYSTFQGKVQIETQQVIVHKEYARPVFDIGRDIQTISSPFLFLALDLPITPLFTDMNEKKIIPQVPLSQILAKFDGKTTQEFGPSLKRHHLTSLPPYLILHIKRFTKNNFVEERNPTIVNFPLRGVEMSDYVDPKPSDPMHTQYDLLSNVFLDTTTASTSSSGTGPGISKRNPAPGEENQMSWKIHIRAGHAGVNANGSAEGENKGEKWFELQDLNVTEVRKEMVFLGETVVQVWERKDLSEGKK